MTTRWKFLREKDGKIVSNSGRLKSWQVGKWKTHRGQLDLCQAGFHCSEGIYQAFSYVQGEILALIECDGASITSDDKEVWQKMRIVKAYKWQKKDSVALSIFAAELVIENFDKVYPNDKRPREAIEAAKKWLADPTPENQKAAWSAAWSAAESAAWSAAESVARSAAWSAAESAARSAESAAWSAAESVARSARSAAWSARSAAWSAAESVARSAAESVARSAAESVARSALIKKIADWMDERVKELEEV